MKKHSIKGCIEFGPLPHLEWEELRGCIERDCSQEGVSAKEAYRLWKIGLSCYQEARDVFDRKEGPDPVPLTPEQERLLEVLDLIPENHLQYVEEGDFWRVCPSGIPCATKVVRDLRYHDFLYASGRYIPAVETGEFQQINQKGRNRLKKG